MHQLLHRWSVRPPTKEHWRYRNSCRYCRSTSFGYRAIRRNDGIYGRAIQFKAVDPAALMTFDNRLQRFSTDDGQQFVVCQGKRRSVLREGDWLVDIDYQLVVSPDEDFSDNFIAF